MDLNHVTHQGPSIDDAELYRLLPVKVRGLLRQINGFIQFGGGLHIRGACHDPLWHSLHWAWMSRESFHLFYRNLSATDIPIAEDCTGNQFLIRGRKMIKLRADTGEIYDLELSFQEFLEAAQMASPDFLTMGPLIQFQNEGGIMLPGQLLNVDPPMGSAEASNGITIKAVPAEEQYVYLRNWSKRVREQAKTTRVRFRAVS